MAVKKSIKNGYSYEDLYDTQTALDKGVLGSVGVLTNEIAGKGGNAYSTVSEQQYNNNPNFNKDAAGKGYTLGSILGMNDPIEANRKKRAEQDKAAGQGFGVSSSILGGSAF